MNNARWWDVAVGVGTLATAIIVVVDVTPGNPVPLAVALAALAAFALAYAVIARPVIGQDGGWRFVLFVVVAAAVLATGVAAAPFLAILQALAYPLAWVLGASRRGGIVGSAVIATGVFAGFAIGNGFTAEAVVAGLVSAAISFAFATALGLWITSIADYGDERARLLAELTAAHAEVETLSRARGAADERERLAREVHDTVAQTLAGLVIIAERSGRQLDEGDPDAAAQSIATVEMLARDALGEARALVARTAAVPADAAFEQSVTRLVERFRAEGRPEIVLDLAASEAALTRDTEVVLLRCLQEALANVRKHAGAESVRVTVAVDAGGAALLEVRDDGRGFDPDLPRTGFGLDGMTERAALAGGEFEVSSTGDAGTTVRLRLPASTPATATATEAS